MSGFSLLVLTDHSGHSMENSVYALVSAMLTDPRCGSIDIASRGFPENAAFFEGGREAPVHVKTLAGELLYDPWGLNLKSDTTMANLDKYDAIFLRLPPPAPREFFQTLEERARDCVIFNRPSGILETSSKAFLMHFRQICPPMKLCYNERDIQLFAERFPIVLKPLYNYGGKGIVRIVDNEVSTAEGEFALQEYFTDLPSTFFPLLAMKFVGKIEEGDKRILVVNGEVQGASLRLPAEGSWLCNIAQGGSAVHADPDERELKMAELLSPLLLEKGILMFGFDTLMDSDNKRYLSEVNTMSIGGIAPMQEQTGRPILKRVSTLIWNYIEEKKENGN